MYFSAKTGQANTLFNEPVPGGALDNAAFLTIVGPDGQPTTLTVVVEVKNVRGHLYPRADELYQLLDKAVRLQMARPGMPFVPVLVCRRAHNNTFQMAKDLGFFVVETRDQPILPHSTVTADAVAEVRDELGYSLVQTEDALPLITNAFREVLPKFGRTSAARWAPVAAALAEIPDTLRRLRDDKLRPKERDEEMDTFHKAIMQVEGVTGRWRHVDPPPPPQQKRGGLFELDADDLIELEEPPF